MRGQDSHETMKVRPFSGHKHRRGKASPQGVPGRSTGPGKDTAGRSECGSGRTGRLTAPAYQSADRDLSQGARKLAFILGLSVFCGEPRESIRAAARTDAAGDADHNERIE